MYFRTCEYCGSNLDPGEICNCEGSHKARGWEKDKETGGYCPAEKKKPLGKAARSKKSIK